MSSLPPIYYHILKRPVSYARGLALQEAVHSFQLAHRDTAAFRDVMLLLEHRPVYTAGRRQTEESIRDDKERVTKLGADFVHTLRGGELTFHGPGQIVGYPLVDLDRWSPVMRTRDFVCRTEKGLKKYFSEEHGVQCVESEHTGLFTSPAAKIGSIGMQVRHRLTSHGFALNVTNEPLAWFNHVIACGLPDVNATSIEEAVPSKKFVLHQEMGVIAQFLGRQFERDIAPLSQSDGELKSIIEQVDELETSN